MIDSLALSWRNAERHERAAFVFVVVASLISVLFSLAGFPAVGYDANVHLNWLDQFTRITAYSIAYPRWLPVSNGGFGSPTFYFYPPLEYWVASFFRLFLPYVPSPFYNLMALVASVGSLFTFAVLARQYSGRPLIIATATLAYSFLAYRFADVFVRDALGEHWAMMFLPLLFLRMRGRFQSIAVLSVAWVGLFLTDIPLAILAGVSVAITVVAERRIASLVEYGVSFVIAVAVGAIYLLPATFLRVFIHPRHLWDIYIRTTGFAVLDLIRYHGWLRFFTVATLGAGTLLLFIVSKKKAGSWWWIAFVAVLLQIPIFAPLWHWHEASLVQFSWRWNAILLLVVAVVFAFRPARVMSAIMIGLALITIAGAIRLSNDFFLHLKLPLDAYRIDAPEYQPAWVPNDPEIIYAYARHHIGDPPAMLLGLTGPRDSIALIHGTPTTITFQVHLTRPAPARFHLFYWPYWKAMKGSAKIALFPDPLGIATANLPSGNYRLELHLVKSREERLGSKISLAGIVLLLAVIALAFIRKKRFTSQGRYASK